MEERKGYLIDWNRIKTVEDLVLILRALIIGGDDYDKVECLYIPPEFHFYDELYHLKKDMDA